MRFNRAFVHPLFLIQLWTTTGLLHIWATVRIVSGFQWFSVSLQRRLLTTQVISEGNKRSKYSSRSTFGFSTRAPATFTRQRDVRAPWFCWMLTSIQWMRREQRLQRTCVSQLIWLIAALRISTAFASVSCSRFIIDVDTPTVVVLTLSLVFISSFTNASYCKRYK